MDAMPRRDEGSLSFDPARGVWIGRYWVALRSGKRSRKQVSDKDKRICQRKLAEALNRVRLGEIEDADPTVATLLAEWLAEASSELKPATVEDYERSSRKLSQAIGHLKVRKLTPLQIEQAWLHEPGRTAQMMRARMRQAMAHAMRVGYLPPAGATAADATKQPKTTPKPKAILTMEQLGEVIEMEPNPVHKALWLFLAVQGARPWSEAAVLRWSELICSDGQWYYRGSKTRAGRETRPIHPAIMPLLEGIRRPDCDWVFPTSTGTAISKRNGARAWANALARAGAPHIEAYSLRRFTATHLLERHLPSAVAAYLGHSTATVTQSHYEQVRREQVLKIVGGQ